MEWSWFVLRTFLYFNIHLRKFLLPFVRLYGLLIIVIYCILSLYNIYMICILIGSHYTKSTYTQVRNWTGRNVMISSFIIKSMMHKFHTHKIVFVKDTNEKKGLSICYFQFKLITWPLSFSPRQNFIPCNLFIGI